MRFNNLCSSINSCIHDLLVNKDLIEFDFDLCSDYVKERNESKLQLTRFAHEPNNKLDILHWAFNYTSSKLDFDFIKSMYEFEDDSYFIWFEEKYPKTTEISEKIKTVIENIGIDSNDKVKRVLITLVDEFKLGNIMLI